MEVTTHVIQRNGQNVSISLAGYLKQDLYATNLELTGQTNWYGSMNLCNLIAHNESALFSRTSSQLLGLHPCLLELGSGLGRAGLMAYKLIRMRGRERDTTEWHCVLTDGEEEIVDLLSHNYQLNFSHDADIAATDDGTGCAGGEFSSTTQLQSQCHCQQLWWGAGEKLNELLAAYPNGFDIILGADLIYENAIGKFTAILSTVSTLLSWRGSAKVVTVLEHSDHIAIADDYTLNASDSLNEESKPSRGGVSNDHASTTTSTCRRSTDTSCYDRTMDFNSYQCPAFYLAITRRELLPIEQLKELALSYGLVVNILEDYTYDIFDTNVDSESVLWRDTILKFMRC